jgi:hypothetical protein
VGNFEHNFNIGRTWEEKVSIWLQENQHYVLNVYEYIPTKNGACKTPKFQTLPSENSLILPDLQVAQDGITHWIEIKSKAGCGYPFQHNPHYRTTGIDLKYWHHYLAVQEASGLEVYIFFVHFNEREIRTASLSDLDCHSRKFIHNGQGMVYWPYDELRAIAYIDENDCIYGCNS